MNLLLDTNVVSEVTRPTPDSRVMDWLHRLDEDRAFISVITLAEIRRGIFLLDPGRRRDALLDWLTDELPARFAGRIVRVDEAVAQAWGEAMAQARRAGRGLSVMDGFIAATARAGGFTLATHNMRDFEGLGLDLLDPWST